MTNPLVTILISTYNRPEWVREAIDSIYAQTYQNFEIRLTRDGGKPVQVRGDERLHFIDRDENRGLAYSFNQSIRNARGEYIAYLGDDDLFYPDHLATLVGALQANPEYGVAYTDLYKVYFNEVDGKRVAVAKNVEVNRDYDQMSLFRYNNQLHVSLMHRRDLFGKAGVYREDVTSLLDWDLNKRMCFYTDFLHVHKITGEYYARYDIETDDRISMRERTDPPAFVRNFLNIRHYRPPKPWPKVVDLSILIPMVEFDKVINKTLRDIHIFTWYPHQVFLTCPVSHVHRIKTCHPNVNVIPTKDDWLLKSAHPNLRIIPTDNPVTENKCMDVLQQCSPEGIKTVIKPNHPIDIGVPWIEGLVNKELERMKNAKENN